MKRIIVVLSLAAIALVAVPAIAQGFDDCVVIDGERFCEVDDGSVSGDGFVFFDDGFVFSEDFDTFDFDDFDEGDVRSGDIEAEVDIFNWGNNVNFCSTIVQSFNTGNVQNEQGVLQYNSTADDIELEGSSIIIASEAEGECVQSIEQAAAVAV